MAVITSEAAKMETEVLWKDDVDLLGLLRSGIVTFVVGTEQVRFNVHVSALSTISEPLKLKMSAASAETPSRQEILLPDVDPVTFGLLLKYAYKGLCGVSDGYSKPAASIFLPRRFVCHNCARLVSDRGQSVMEYPFCTATCRSDYFRKVSQPVLRKPQKAPMAPPQPNSFSPDNVEKMFPESFLFGGRPPQQNSAKQDTSWQISFSIHCVLDGTPIEYDPLIGPQLLCDQCDRWDRGKGYPPFRKEAYTQADRPARCGPGFGSMKFSCDSMTHERLREHMNEHIANRGSNAEGPTLLQHAKLYVLAREYEIANLPEICLHKLHAELAQYSVSQSSIDEITQLVLYAYDNTSDSGDILSSTNPVDKLRDLVMRYVVDSADRLMGYARFRNQGMLRTGGKPSADFMALKYTDPYASTGPSVSSQVKRRIAPLPGSRRKYSDTH